MIWVKYNLYANTNKCSLFVPEVKYLGHIISTNGISVHPSKLTGMVTPYLSYRTAGVSRVAHYFRTYIPQYSDTDHQQILKHALTCITDHA